MSAAPKLWRVRSDATGEWLTPLRQWSPEKALAGAWPKDRADSVAGKALGGARCSISLVRVGKRWKPPPECPYCGKPAEIVDGAAIYPARYDLARQWFWRCAPCGAWVGCHAGGFNALGRLANAELRRAKMEAHAAFDPLWKRKIARDNFTKSAARSAGYAWLAGQLGIDPAECHIGMMDVERCRRVVEVCRPPGGFKRRAAGSDRGNQPRAQSAR